MTLLETFIANPWAAALGWTLLHSLWEGAILSALLGVVLLATKSPPVRYAAACLSMLMLLGTFSVTLFHLAPHAAHAQRALKPLPFSVWNTGLISRPNTWEPSFAALTPWLALFWIAGVFVFYLRYAAGFLSISRLHRRGVCSAAEHWQQKFDRLRAQLQVSRPVLLLESSLADTPMVIGHFRPLVLMPIGLFTGLPTAQVETILLHELAHIGRHDFLVNAIQNLLDGLLFYHPGIWWISRVIRAEREKCCDDVVVAIGGNAHEYARALATLEQNRWSGREPAVAAKGGSLMKRIRRLLYPTGPNGAWTPFFATAILLITVAVTLGAWQSEPPRSPVLKACPAAVQSGPADVINYHKWLNEDVVYIIDDAERAAFQKLTTDDERACFVEQFWERRNPTPGSAENTFKSEHYRRIAMANKRYAASVPGWQTDRGHMYIVYGPPDEIESHPKGGLDRPYATEEWAYHHVEGTSGMSFFAFIDKTGRGDFHLAPSNAH